MEGKAGLAKRIWGLLIARAEPMADQVIATTLGEDVETVQKRLNDLVKKGVVAKNGDGLWEGLDVNYSEPGEKKEVTLDQREQFMQFVKSTGVKSDVIPTLTNIFFTGDIHDIKWLREFLIRSCAGFVTPPQQRLIYTAWTRSNGLPFDPSDFPEETAKPGKGEKTKAEDEEEGKLMDPGVGWEVKKDKDGEWVAIPGGPMTHKEAMDYAMRRQMLKGYGVSGDGDEGAAEGEQGGKTRGGKPRVPIMERVMEKWLDDMLETKKGGGDNSQIEILRAEIAKLKEDKDEKRLAGIEANLALVASRDPLQEYEEVRRRRHQLGLDAPAITAASPFVQVLTDTGAKVEKQVDRVAGILERKFLQDGFTPENKRSPEEREKAAGELLQDLDKQEKSKQLRKAAFNV